MVIGMIQNSLTLPIVVEARIPRESPVSISGECEDAISVS
jgi:hypothetical protein